MSEKLQELEEKQALERWELLNEDAKQKQRDKALLIIGGVHVADKIASSISSQVMNALILFQKEGMYRNFGYQRFADFLDEWEHSPMTKHQFYERKKVYELEGDQLFDLLNATGISVRTRKLLGKGQVELDGENVLVKFSEDEQLTIHKNDINKLMETVSALADANADKSKKLERGEADHKRLKQKLIELENNVGSSRGRLSPTEERATNAMAHLAALCTTLNEATIVEVQMFIDRDFKLLATQWQRLNDIIANKGLADSATEVLNEDEANRLASLLDDEE